MFSVLNAPLERNSGTTRRFFLFRLRSSGLTFEEHWPDIATQGIMWPFCVDKPTAPFFYQGVG